MRLQLGCKCREAGSRVNYSAANHEAACEVRGYWYHAPFVMAALPCHVRPQDIAPAPAHSYGQCTRASQAPDTHGEGTARPVQPHPQPHPPLAGTGQRDGLPGCGVRTLPTCPRKPPPACSQAPALPCAGGCGRFYDWCCLALCSGFCCCSGCGCGCSSGSGPGHGSGLGSSPGLSSGCGSDRCCGFCFGFGPGPYCHCGCGTPPALASCSGSGSCFGCGSGVSRGPCIPRGCVSPDDGALGCCFAPWQHASPRPRLTCEHHHRHRLLHRYRRPCLMYRDRQPRPHHPTERQALGPSVSAGAACVQAAGL